MSNDHVLCEQARVRTGWELVDLISRLSDEEAERLLSARFEAERSRAAKTIQPLKPRPGEPHQTYQRGANQSRFCQTLDYVRPGDRVFEVGPGGGHLAGLLLRDGEIAAYHGIDLSESPLRKTQELLKINGLAARAQLAKRNLYELTRADIEALDVNLIVCCEVLEHVPDPERAMKNLAYVLPSTAELLISVPLLGRLEHVWGHLAIFDTIRLRNMVEEAGLVPHSVQVVDNRWVLVLASHGQGPSPRAARAAAAAPDVFARRSPDPAVPTAFRAIDLGAGEAQPSASTTTRLVKHHLESGPDGLLCDMTGSRSWRSRWRGVEFGGVRLPATAPLGLRFEIALDDVHAVTAFHVDAYARNKCVAQWRWDLRARRPRKDTVTFVVRPGRESPHFKATKIGKLESVDAFDVYAAIKPGSTARFRLTRAAAIV